MATELDFNPVEFITIGTIGPKGQRVFHLQAGHEGRIISFIIEKEQAFALSEAIREVIDELDERTDSETTVQMASMDMDLREPIEPLFRIAQIGLAVEEGTEMIILIAQELMTNDVEAEAGVVRMWCSREQMYALAIQALAMYDAGRPEPKQNGRILYYWT
jgi:uncharacterized repeat protein (TIGR03847 family)